MYHRYQVLTTEYFSQKYVHNYWHPFTQYFVQLPLQRHQLWFHIFQVPRSILANSPLHFIPKLLYGVSVRGMWWPWQNLYSEVSARFLCRFCGAFWITVLLEGHPRPILSLLAVRFSFNVSNGVHDSMYPDKISRAFGRKTAPQHQNPLPYFTVGMRCIFLGGHLSVQAKPTFNVCGHIVLLWSHLTI